MFDWSNFDGNTVVQCETMEDVHSFLKECESHGYRWANDHSAPTKKDYGYQNVVYCPQSQNKELAYTSLCDAKEDNLTILLYSGLRAPALLRICYILGGEKTPLKVGEHFRIQGYVPEFWIDKDGHFAFGGENFTSFALAAIAEAINHPEKIIRRPQFSDDEKALFKAFHALGYDYWARTIDNYLFACQEEPELGEDYVKTGSKCFEMNPDFLPSLECGQKVNAAAYLESEAAK